MRKRNQMILILLSVIIIICALFLPANLFRMYDSRLLHHVRTEEFSGIPTVEGNQLDTKKRLQLICNYGTDDTIILADKKDKEPGNEDKNINAALTEIERMQTMGAFPQIDINRQTVTLIDSATQQYTDLSSVGNYVKLNALTFSCNSGLFQLWRDAETNQIYQYSITSTQSSFSGLKVPDLAKNLSDYLSISLSNLSYAGDSPVKFATEDREIRYVIQADALSLSILLS